MNKSHFTIPLDQPQIPILTLASKSFGQTKVRQKTVSESFLSKPFRLPKFKAAECFKPIYTIRIVEMRAIHKMRYAVKGSKGVHRL